MNSHIEKQDSNSLVLLFMKGDENAYAYFYRLFIEDLYTYGLSLGSDEETIKDIVQDVFIHIYLSKIEFHSAHHLKCYLLQSVKNKLYDIYKSPFYNKTSSIDDSSEFIVNFTIIDELLDKEQETILKNKIDKMLSILTNKQKEILFLRYSQELEYEDIAKILGMTVMSSRKLVSRAIQRLRQEYGMQYIRILFMLKF